MKSKRRHRPIGWLVATVFCLAATVGAFVRVGGWDESYYLSQVSSVIEDRDLDLRNDLLHLSNDPSETRRMLTTTLSDGTLHNTFTIGPVLAWSPAYLAGLAVREFAARSAGIVPPRWTSVQFIALHLLALLLVLYVLWFLARWLRRSGAAPDLVPLCSVALIVGSPLLVYGFAAYTMTHLLSAAAACWFLAAVLDFDRRPTLGSALSCGAALGLVFLARWQGISIALALLLPFLRLIRAPGQWRRATGLAAAMAASSLLVASLQLRAWHLQFGSWVALPQGQGYLRWTHPEWFRFLFSGVNGMFVWSPLFAIGVLGLLLPWRLRLSPGWRWVALTVLFFDVYLNATVGDWWGGSSYGARRMTADLPLIALGLANMTRLVPQTSRRRWLAACLAAICAYGLFTANLSRHGVQDLALVFTGAPSDAPGTERESGAVREPAVARAIAVTLPIRVTKTDYFSRRGALTNGGRTASLGIILLSLIAGAVFLQRMRPAPALRFLMAASAAGVVLLQIWLTLGERRDSEELRRWQGLVRQTLALQISDKPARGDGYLSSPIPETGGDPYRYLIGFHEYANGRALEAKTVFAGLAAKGYPPAQEMVQRAEGGDGATLVRLIPGSFVDPAQGAPFCRFLLPAPARRVRIEFDLLLREMAPGRRSPVAALMGSGERIVSAGIEADGTLWMQAEDEPPSQLTGFLANHAYPFALDWDPSSGRASLSTWIEPGKPLELQVHVRPEVALGAIAVRFGRTPAGPGRPGADVTGPAFLNLRVVSFATPDS